MSFQNFDSFQNQADPTAAAPAPADTAMTGQPDPAAGFQGPPAPDAGGAPVPQPVSEGKTTLWYVPRVSTFSLY